MPYFLQFFVLIPVTGFLLSLFIPRKKESAISSLGIITASVHLLSLCAFVVYWLIRHAPALDIKHLVVFKSNNLEIFIDYYFDGLSATYALTGAVIMLAVSIFSRYYMHREEGFKRYFNNLLLFYCGYNIIIFSGNFETLFVGWEILGVSSFLLIGFYRDRFLPVKNSLKVISIYRLSDICLMLAMWMSHHLWHRNITFFELADANAVMPHLEKFFFPGLFISLMILVAAAIKSAQLPFTSWLPRAMEGPTSSSAIFYGSLSVHMGVFILLRTFPFWEHFVVMKTLIIALGLITAFVATGIARAQSTVKSQIAYASAAQIGLMFIEIALGFHVLALIHFAGNAFLRMYQLLVSPSVLSYLIHEQFYNFKPDADRKEPPFKKIRHSLYILSLCEWNLDHLLKCLLWDPFKWLGRKLSFLESKPAYILLVIIYLFGVYVFCRPGTVSAELYFALPYLFAGVAFMLVLKSFSSRNDAARTWLFVVAAKFYIALAISLNERFDTEQILIFLSGACVAGLVGYLCLKKIKGIDNDIHLNKFHGYIYEQPKLSILFLLSCLGLLGFPITPAFIGIDIMFTHIHANQIVLISLTALSFIFIELSVLRMYARIFLGQHKKNHHPMAFKAS
jgi:NADH-quinone oxidoreductase subunit L